MTGNYYPAAKESGIDERIFENVEDIANNSLIYSLSMGIYNPGRFAHLPNYSINDEVYRVQTEIIRKVAGEGDCVIVGRCATICSMKIPGASGCLSMRISTSG